MTEAHMRISLCVIRWAYECFQNLSPRMIIYKVVSPLITDPSYLVDLSN